MKRITLVIDNKVAGFITPINAPKELSLEMLVAILNKIPHEFQLHEESNITNLKEAEYDRAN